MSSVKLENINKSYTKDVPIIRNLNLNISSGEFAVIVGPSGCGKSTLLRLIAGLEEVTDGEIYIDDNRVTTMVPKDRNISMVFQNYALYPQMTVFDNMAFGLKMRKKSKTFIKEKIKWASNKLGLEEYLFRKPKELSGGQKQRVALGRAIVREPEVFLFDEPLSNLDAKLRIQMRSVIKSLHDELGTTMIYVTHDQVEAMTLADRIVIMKDGVIEQIGTPLDLFEKPATKFVATFIGSPSMNMIKATITNQSGKLFMKTDDNISVPVPDHKINSLTEGQIISFGFRAEDIVPLKFGQKPSNSWSINSKVNLAEPLGTETLIFTNLGNTEIVSRMFTPELVNSNDELEFALNLDRTYLFDDKTDLAI